MSSHKHVEVSVVQQQTANGLSGQESNQLLPSHLQINIDDTYICFGPTECYRCEVGF